MPSMTIETHLHYRIVQCLDANGEVKHEVSDPIYKFLLVVFGRTVAAFEDRAEAGAAEKALIDDELTDFLNKAKAVLRRSLALDDLDLDAALQWSLENYAEFLGAELDAVRAHLDRVVEDLKEYWESEIRLKEQACSLKSRMGKAVVTYFEEIETVVRRALTGASPLPNSNSEPEAREASAEEHETEPTFEL